MAENAAAADDDRTTAARMMQFVEGLFAAEGSDAWCGAKAILRQMADEDPEVVARLRAMAAIRRAGLRDGATAH